jgi:hypothetical protein
MPAAKSPASRKKSRRGMAEQPAHGSLAASLPSRQGSFVREDISYRLKSG